MFLLKYNNMFLCFYSKIYVFTTTLNRASLEQSSDIERKKELCKLEKWKEVETGLCELLELANELVQHANQHGSRAVGCHPREVDDVRVENTKQHARHAMGF